MRIIKTIGLLLFILGFAIFNSTFFLAEYRLTDEIFHKYLDEERAELLKDQAFGLAKMPHDKFEFLDILNQSFEEANKKAISNYGITDGEIDEIVAANSGSFSLETAKEVLNSEYKFEKFNAYGSWLDGRSFNSPEELRQNLSEVANNIASFSVLQEKGFDEYKIKDLRYSLTKDATISPVKVNPVLFLWLTYVLCIIGAMMYILPKVQDGPPGIKNNGIYHNVMKNRGWLGILTGSYLIIFYIFLYFTPEYMTQWILMVDPISQFLKNDDAGRFFLYGFIYTLCILVMGVRMIINYRHNRYQIVRTISVMFFQTSFAFLIPEILLRLNKPYFDFKNIWPLDYDFFFDNELNTLVESGGLGIFMIGWGLGLIAIGVPVFVYFFGKRWYCSWVCGCGGLAETLGDPYRQLSDKSLKAWKIERWMIHSVLVFAVVMTATVIYTYFTGESELLGINSYKIREVYGAWIGAGFAGVIGTGFYPLMGNRVWCRFGCPLAAYLGIVQRFKSRFRITTNGGQCISCGNCSTYCEMGIDVRWYAQRGQNIVRSSCVGCGICSAVCPRGVLKLENGGEKGRINDQPVLIGNDGVVSNINLSGN